VVRSVAAGSRDATAISTLAAGNKAVVNGVNGATGATSVELYEVP